jgi:hypothetical protein
MTGIIGVMRRVRRIDDIRLDAMAWVMSAMACVMGALLVLVPACKNPAEQACLSQFTSAQAVVVKIEAEDLASVTGSVAAVEEALGTCAGAGRSSEVEELSKAQAQLTAHRDRLVRRAEMLARRTEVSPEELAILIESGDPKCPRGQGYRHQKSGKHIVCVGPQPVDMSREQAEAYFKGRGYRLSPGSSPTELRFEYGAELVVFAYGDAGGAARPRCVTLYPPPDRSWQEATARLTGIAPARLEANQPIRRPTGVLGFVLEESPEKVIARIGNCNG